MAWWDWRKWTGRAEGVKLTDGEFWSGWFGNPNSAGKSVTRDSALTVSAAWACIRLLSESTGIIPMSLYRARSDGGRETVKDHPVYGIIHDQWNVDDPANEQWESIVASLATDGNGYALKRRVGDKVVSLELIDAPLVDITRDDMGRKRYNFTHRGQPFRDKSDDDVIHYRGWNYGAGEKGLSAIKYGANTIGISMAADDTAGQVFRNGLVTAGFIETDKVLTKDQRAQFIDSLTAFRVDDSAGKMMLLEGAFKFNPIGMKFDDMQMLASRGYSTEQICGIFRIPPFMIGHTEKNTSWGAGLEQQLIGFLTYALMPYLKRIEKRTTIGLLTKAERLSGLYLEFNYEGLLRADSAARATFYKTLLDNGVVNRNEVRAKENMGTIDGGERFTINGNLIPLDKLDEVLKSRSTPKQPPEDPA